MLYYVHTGGNTYVFRKIKDTKKVAWNVFR